MLYYIYNNVNAYLFMSYQPETLRPNRGADEKYEGGSNKFKFTFW
jgi:hypothetical protein